MQSTLNRRDGLHITAKATLAQLALDTTLADFADGLILEALLNLEDEADLTLADALHHAGTTAIDALLTALLVLDAELTTVVDDETRIFPLPAFLSYRAQLPPEQFPPNTVRLPPLNPDGHYIFKTLGDFHHLAIRMDIHPILGVAGHVRIAKSDAPHPPHRLLAFEGRFERQVLTGTLIEAALAAGSVESSGPLTAVEQRVLGTVLKKRSPVVARL